MLLLEFFCYIWFFYYTHTEMSEDGSAPPALSALAIAGLVRSAHARPVFDAAVTESTAFQSLKSLREVAKEHHPKNRVMTGYIWFDLGLLACTTVSLVFSSIYLLEAIHAPAHHLSESFVGLVLMPCILASVEYVTDAIRSHKEGVAWVAECAFGSSIRISLFVFPVAVIVGWISGAAMDMMLDGFQVAIVALAVLMVNHVIHNAFAHW